ncbi:amidase [Nonomuraea sp. NBC_01738]|uniref:amidase n=1 Tax=Nonomuraea sp. NBC_01738 TaxID=2976003 RepID=UPI002E152881|nr:amidase [Nonomuraea sp. NBC_01738]
MTTALELAAELRAGRISAVEVVTESLERIEAERSRIGGVAFVDPERALADAVRADRRIGQGSAGVFEGVPFTVKDWIDVEGWVVTGATGSTGAASRRPAADATAVARLRDAGAVVVAITSAVADNHLHGATRNPVDPGLAPGGSSSGAAALVGAGAVPFGLGSDSGGSIRLPAAWCGVTGLKPSFGRVPLTGHFPRCGAMEDARTVIGPLATDVADLHAVLRVIAGPDGLDAGVAPVPLPDPGEVRMGELRAGVVAGHEIELPWATTVIPDPREEALDITERYWGRAHLSGAENVRLLWDWDRFRRRMLQATEGLDIVVTPAAETPPPPWRESRTADYRWTLPWSLTGSPAVVVPPAVQVVARPWMDHVALAAAAHLYNDA